MKNLEKMKDKTAPRSNLVRNNKKTRHKAGMKRKAINDRKNRIVGRVDKRNKS